MQFCKVKEKSEDIVVNKCILYAKDDEDAKEQYQMHFRKFDNTTLEVNVINMPDKPQEYQGWMWRRDNV